MKYIIEAKVNPGDEWKPIKTFKNKARAMQSLETLIKHRFNAYMDVNNLYNNYRLIEKPPTS